MNNEETEFLINYKWLEAQGVFDAWLEVFKTQFSDNNVKPFDVLMFCKRFNFSVFARELISRLGFEETRLVIDHVDGNLFYNGDVHVKGDIYVSGKHFTESLMCVKGTLKIDGILTAEGAGRIDAKHIIADDINLCHDSYCFSQYISVEGFVSAYNLRMGWISKITGDVKVTNTIKLNEGARIYGNINTGFLKIDRGWIRGDVDADVVYNKGQIDGDVNTVAIDTVNGGEVTGTITYK